MLLKMFRIVVHYRWLLFVCLIHTPSMSALFPYTTLFRSLRGQRVVGGAGVHLLRGARMQGERRRAGDRKSTRLNSSHLGISYAVFCLKKKTRRVASTTTHHTRRSTNGDPERISIPANLIS